MTETLFKFLGEDGRPCNGGSGVWPLPRGDKPGKWLKVEGELVPCRNGLHLCTAEHLLTWAAPALYVAEAGKERIDHRDKLVVRRARLLYRVEAWNDRSSRLFAADCAERALKREERAGRKVDKRSWDAVRIVRDYARGKASDKELAAARAAARAAAWAAAREAARAAARDAARDAARAAAGAAARAAERDWQTKRLLRYLKIEATT